jgi:hypothetical protein
MTAASVERGILDTLRGMTANDADIVGSDASRFKPDPTGSCDLRVMRHSSIKGIELERSRGEGTAASGTTLCDRLTSRLQDPEQGDLCVLFRVA